MAQDYVYHVTTKPLHVRQFVCRVSLCPIMQMTSQLFQMRIDGSAVLVTLSFIFSSLKKEEEENIGFYFWVKGTQKDAVE